MAVVRSEAWFRSHRYGLGVRPASSHGVAAMVLFIFILAAAWSDLHGVVRIVICTAVVAGYYGLVHLKTPGGLRWRWGASA